MTEFIDEPDTIRNEAMDDGLLVTDNRTTELCKLLEERGVKWKTKSYSSALLSNERLTDTYWQAGNAAWQFTECSDGRTYLTLIGIWPDCTPEQAVAATLGRPKVKKVRGMTYDEHGGEVYFLACSGCGDWVDGDLDCIGEYDGPNFCHNCGGEFDGPLLCRVCGELADMEFGDMCAECYWHEGEGNDELNAKLGSRTCHDKNGFDESIGFECTSYETTVDCYMQTTTNDKPEQFKFCPNCGKVVKQ